MARGPRKVTRQEEREADRLSFPVSAHLRRDEQSREHDAPTEGKHPHQHAQAFGGLEHRRDCTKALAARQQPKRKGQRVAGND